MGTRRRHRPHSLVRQRLGLLTVNRPRSSPTLPGKPWSRLLPALFLGLLALLMTAAFTVGSAGAAGSPCDAGSGATNVTRWTGASGDNNWDTPGNWDNGVPTPTKIACILKPGTYVVNAGVDSTAMALSLELGATSGSQKLHVSGKANARQGQLTLSNQDPSQGVNANGEIDLAEAASITEGNVTVSAGTLTNRGKVASFAAGSGPNTIAGNFDNRGALQVDENTNGSGTSNWTSSGTINIAAGKTLALSWDANSSFAQTAGTITNNGTFDQTNGTFSASGNGTQTGSPLQFDGAVTIDPSGTGSGSFESRSAGATLGSDIGAGYTLRVAGREFSHEGKLIVPADHSNRGTIELGGENTQGTLAITTGSTLTSAGSIVSTFTAANSTNNGPNHLSGRVVNPGSIIVAEASLDGSADISTSGTVSVGNGSRSSLSVGTLIQSGDIQIADFSQLSVSGNDTQTAGVTNLDGTDAQLASSALVVQGGTLSGIGTVSGPVTNGGLIAPGASGVTGTLSISGTYTQQAAGDLAIKVTATGNDLLASLAPRHWMALCR